LAEVLREEFTTLQSRNNTDQVFEIMQIMQRTYYNAPEDLGVVLKEKIQKAFETLNTPEEPLTLETISTVMDYFTETDRLAHAMNLLSCMRNSDLKPTEHIYRSLLNALMRYDDIDVAMMVLDYMREDNIVVDLVTYERLFFKCAISVYPLGAQNVYSDLAKAYDMHADRRARFKLQLRIVNFMYWMGIKQSRHGKRGWITPLMLVDGWVHPVNHANNKMLEPDLGPNKEELLIKLREEGYNLSKGRNVTSFSKPNKVPEIEQSTEEKLTAKIAKDVPSMIGPRVPSPWMY